MRRELFALRFGSLILKLYQSTPMIEQDFNSGRFMGTFAMPAVNPTISNLPFLPRERRAGSVYQPPTGSRTTSMPLRPAASLIAAANCFEDASSTTDG